VAKRGLEICGDPPLVDEFFEPPSPSKIVFEVLPPREWDGPPRDAVPAIVPVERVLARNQDVVVYLACLWVYPTGFEFEVFVVAKDQSAKLDPFNFDHQYGADESGTISPAQLRLGLSFADGRKATNTGDRFDWDGEFDSHPNGPVMSSSHSGGGGGDWSCSLWVWPLPPPGPLQFVCEWPELNIPLTDTNLDSAAIIEAASRAKAIFPSS
jgi:hypothetical protein